MLACCNRDHEKINQLRWVVVFVVVVYFYVFLI